MVHSGKERTIDGDNVCIKELHHWCYEGAGKPNLSTPSFQLERWI